jgi:hypothetical protein
MSNYLTADARAPGEASSGGMPLSSLYHEIGLAAVATELNLQLNTLAPAEAVEMGAAALLLAGDGPSVPRSQTAAHWAAPSLLWSKRLFSVTNASFTSAGRKSFADA